MASSAGVVGILRVLLAMDTADFESGGKKSIDTAKKLEKELDKFGSKAVALGAVFSAGLTVPIVGFAAASIKAAADFELAFANVRKTVGQVGATAETSAAYYRDLSDFLRQTAREIPKTTEELARFAALGGQFGISADGLKQFTRTIAELDIAVSDLSGEEAATGLAQLRNITRSSEADISKMAATLVTLGNNGASSEGHILELSKRIAGAGSLIGLTTPQIMGLSAAIANVGINAEAGGTAFSRTLSQMSTAADTGGEKLEAFARIAGMSAQDFATTFKNEPIKAVEAFISGLARTKDAGENLSLILGDIGAEGIRQADTLKRLTLAHTDVTKQLGLAGKAYQEDSAHKEAAAEKTKTFWNQLIILKNEVKDAAIEFGTALLPILLKFTGIAKPLVDLMGLMARGFAALPSPIQTTVVIMGGMLAAIGPILVGLGGLTMALSTLVGAFQKGGVAAAAMKFVLPGVGTAASGAAIGVGLLRVALAGLGIGLAITAVTMLVEALWKVGPAADDAANKSNRLKDSTGNIVMTLDEAREAAKKTGAGAMTLGVGVNLAADAMGLLRTSASGALKPQTSLTEEMRKTEAAVRALSAEQLREIKAGDALGMTTTDITKKLQEQHPEWKMTEKVIDLAKQKMDAYAKSSTEAGAALDAYIEKLRAQGVEQNQAVDAQLKANRDLGIGTQSLAEWIAKISLLTRVSNQDQAAAEKQAKDWALANGAVLAPSIQAVGSAIYQTEEDLQRLFDSVFKVTGSLSNLFLGLGHDMDGSLRRTANEATNTYLQIKADGTSTPKQIADAFKAMNEAIDRANYSLGERFESLWDRIKVAAYKAFDDILERFMSKVIRGISDALGGQKGSWGQVFSGLLGRGAGAGSAATAANGFGGAASNAGVAAGGLGLGGAGGASAGGGTGLAGTGAGTAAVGVAATAIAGFAMGKLGQKIFGGAGAPAAAFGAGAGAGAGAVIGSFVPVVGTAIGAIVGGLVGMAAGFMGTSKAVKETRANVQEYQTQLRATLTDEQRAEAGGEAWKETVIAVRDAYMATGRTAEEAQAAVAAMWDTGNPARAIAAVREIDQAMQEYALHLEEVARREERVAEATGIFEEIMSFGSEGIPAAFQPALDMLIELGLLTDDQIEKMRGLGTEKVNTSKMEAGMELFKGRREILGPQYEQAKVNEQAKAYIQAIDDMTKGGASLDQVLHDAQEEISALVQSALESGSTLPANMQPWIESLIAQGKLVDKNGKKITDVSQLKFGDAVKTESEKAKDGWDKILAKIQELIEKISNPLERAIDNVTRDRTVNIDVNTRERGTDREREGGPEREREGYASGTMGRHGQWFANFGRGTSTQLHGDEAVVTRNQALPFALDILAAKIPNLSASAAQGIAGALAGTLGGSASTATTTNSINVLPVLMGSGMSARDIGKQAASYMATAGLANDEGGITSAFESVIDNWFRTYARG